MSHIYDWLKRKWVRGVLAGVIISIIGYFTNLPYIMGFGSGVFFTSFIFAD